MLFPVSCLSPGEGGYGGLDAGVFCGGLFWPLRGDAFEDVGGVDLVVEDPEGEIPEELMTGVIHADGGQEGLLLGQFRRLGYSPGVVVFSGASGSGTGMAWVAVP